MDVYTACDLPYTRAAFRCVAALRAGSHLRRPGEHRRLPAAVDRLEEHMPDSSLSGGDMALVAVVLVISLAALGFAAYLVKAVLAADQGTAKMREIAQAVQEGAAAYLRRQFRTLGVFAVIVFLLLLVLPVAEGGWGTRVGRAIFFLIGAVLLRVRRLHRHDAGHPRQRPRRGSGERRRLPSVLPHRLPHRWRRRHDHRRPRPVRSCAGPAVLRRHRARSCSRASASAAPCWPCSCASAAASSPRPPTSAPTWSARSRRASPRTTRATPPPSPTTWATTSVTAPAWRPTSSSPTRSRWSRR